ncbi:MAG: hypothetical protein ACTS22_07555 [Phycisphaerales bacterium]
MLTPRTTANALRTALLACLAVAAAAIAGTPAAGQVPPDPDVLTIIHEDAEGRRTMLLDPRNFPIYHHLRISPDLRPRITIRPAQGLGYDIVYDFTNTSDTTATIGRLGVGIITLGPELTWYDHNRDSAFRTQRRSDYRSSALVYPDRLYSPVAVLMNDRFAVGVSLLYDILSDRHEARVGILKPEGSYEAGPGGAGYAVTFEFADTSDRGINSIQHPAELRPGESRRYVVAVRAVERSDTPTITGPQDWLETLQPYHDHFRALYGGVTYERDPRPIRKRAVANISARDRDNPDAFVGHDFERPDLVGFAPLASEILNNPGGFATTMLWAPTGLQFNTSLNFPSRFTSRWLEVEPLTTAFDTQRGLASIPRRGGSFGLWWGRAGEMTPAWNTSPSIPLDMHDPAHLAFAENELQLAIRAGATTIGLDAYVHARVPVWDQYEWLSSVRRRHPDLRIVIEPVTCDVMHTIAGTYLRGWQIVDGRGYDRFYKVRRPFYLADYLVPGHESWAYFRYGDIRLLPDGSHDAARIQRDAEFFAGLGYTPILNTPFNLTRPDRGVAVPSWLTTVPDRLKTDAHRRGAPDILPVPDEDPDAEGGGNDDRNAGERGDGSSRRPLRLPNGRIIWIERRGER